MASEMEQGEKIAQMQEEDRARQFAERQAADEQPELIARLIHEETARFYAAPQYLAKAGRPEDVRDLSSHDFIRHLQQVCLCSIGEFGKLPH